MRRAKRMYRTRRVRAPKYRLIKSVTTEHGPVELRMYSGLDVYDLDGDEIRTIVERRND